MLDRRKILAGIAAVGATAAMWPARGGGTLQGDVAILRRAYTQLHPGLYRYNTPSQIAARFDALEKDFARKPAQAEAYLILSRFLATIRCGHTYANFYNQPAKTADALFAGRNKLPFHFRWAGNRMVVLRNQSNDPRLRAGTEILDIDGRAPSRILANLIPFARADGSNDAKRRALLDVRGLDRFETFDVFFGLLYPPKDGTFKLRLREPGSTTIQSVVVKALDLTERRAAMPREPEGDDTRVRWTLAFPTPGKALLTMPDWALYDSKWNWRTFLDDAFDEIARRNARGLIVDIRGNEGGLDCGNEIIARLIDNDLALEAYERRVRFRKTPADLDPYLDTWDPSFKTLGEGAIDIGNGFLRLPPQSDGEDGTLIRPKGPRFKGTLIVLTDAQNSSATFQFAQIVQANRFGPLCGEPTGGNQRGINGGAFFFLKLPASGLEADLPLIGRFPTTPKPDAGLTPDIPVTGTIEDIATGRDRILETALRLIA